MRRIGFNIYGSECPNMMVTLDGILVIIILKYVEWCKTNKVPVVEDELFAEYQRVFGHLLRLNPKGIYTEYGMEFGDLGIHVHLRSTSVDFIISDIGGGGLRKDA